MNRNSINPAFDAVKALKAKLEDPNPKPRRDLSLALLKVSKSLSGSLKGSSRFRQSALDPGVVARFQIQRKTDGSDEYKEDNLSGSIELLQSEKNPVDFRLVIQSQDLEEQVVVVPLPARVYWNVVSKVHQCPIAGNGPSEVQVIQLCYYDPAKNGKVKIRIGLPLTNDRDRKQARKFGDLVMMANSASGGCPEEGGGNVDLRLGDSFSSIGSSSSKAQRQLSKHSRSEGNLRREGSKSRLVALKRGLPSMAA